jgi:hypothetical protein
VDLIWQLLDPSWTQVFICDQAGGRQTQSPASDVALDIQSYAERQPALPDVHSGTRLMATASSSSRIPTSPRKLSKVEPLCFVLLRFSLTFKSVSFDASFSCFLPAIILRPEEFWESRASPKTFGSYMATMALNAKTGGEGAYSLGLGNLKAAKRGELAQSSPGGKIREGGSGVGSGDDSSNG